MKKNKEVELTKDELMLAEVGGKKVAEWEAEWSYVENGFKAEQPNLDGLLGLYRATLRGEIMYIGNSAELNRGLKKRLRDYSRASDSARDHFGAQKIIEHIEHVRCEIIVTGIDEDAQKNTAILKRLLILLHSPEWNVGEEVIDRKRRLTYLKRAAII